MSKRIITGVIAVLLLLLAIWLHPMVFYVFLVLFTAVGMYEYFRALEHIQIRPFRFLGFLSFLLIYAISGIQLFQGFGLTGLFGENPELSQYGNAVVSTFTPVFLVGIFIIVACYLLIRPERHSFTDAAATLFGILYIPGLLMYLIFIRMLDHGQWLLLLMFVGIIASDSCAYFVGNLYGRHKLAPKVSPNKTVEGAIGSLAGTVIFVVAAGSFLSFADVDLSVGHLVILGLLISVLSQLGDLTASSIKRYTKIKDYGKWIPGHGGAMDRCDSVLFVAPVFYFYIAVLVNGAGLLHF